MTEKKGFRDPKKEEAEKLVHKPVEAIDEHPDKVSDYYDLGSLLTRLNDYQQAEELFMKALGIFGTEGDKDAMNLLNYGLGNLYYEIDKVNEAIKFYNKIDDPKLKADSYPMLAQSCMKKGQYKQAVAYGLTALELRPDDPEINQVIGDSLLALGEFKQAEAYYDAILKYHPGRVDTRFNRGVVAMVLSEPYKDYLTQVKQLDPNYYHKSEQWLNDIEKALQTTQKKD